MDLPWLQVDVFTNRPLAGNALAVFFPAAPLRPDTMQGLARETNLSETVFVEAVDAVAGTFRLRIFTPVTELPFAGHPVLGAAAAVASRSGRAGAWRCQLVGQEVPVSVAGSSPPLAVTMVQHVQARRAPEEGGALAALLGLEPDEVGWGGLAPTIASAGLPHLLVPLRSALSVERAAARPAALAALARRWQFDGCYVFSPAPKGADHHLRARLFAPGLGVTEDPATGSAAGPLAAVLAAAGALGDPPPWVIVQGVELNRPSRIQVAPAGPEAPGQVAVTGEVVTVAAGTFRLPA